jgi:hypothetical protein
MYLVYSEGSSSSSSSSGSSSSSPSTGELLGAAAVNALVIVSVICVATFVLVLCYYYRCLKLMVGYLVFACANLLGYTGGFMAQTAISRYRLTVDYLTLAFLMYNFAVVGVVAVFWQKGVPRWMTQLYLVCVSVIMAWTLTKLPEWTSWALLVALALYDLCAVLTPCGPLRALVHLAQTRRDPIPGLLYEADVGGSGGGGGRRRDDEGGPRDTLVPAATTTRERRAAAPGPGAAAAMQPSSAGGHVAVQSWERPALPARELLAADAPASAAKGGSGGGLLPGGASVVANPAYGVGGDATGASAPASRAKGAHAHSSTPGGRLTNAAGTPEPLSARLSVRALTHAGTLDRQAAVAAAASGDYSELPSSSSSAAGGGGTPAGGYTMVAMPTGGGGGGGGGGDGSGHSPSVRVADWPSSSALGAADAGSAGAVVSSAVAETGQPRDAGTRGSLNNGVGEIGDEEENEEEEDEEEDRGIKLGLGDFVFYSVLVSRAALYDMSTMAACFVAVVMGLGGTLFLLGIFRKALPALPISIFLGVIFYLITRLAITPMITELVVRG